MFDLGDETMGQSFPIAVGEQPPQRLENFGVNAVSDTELLAMLLQGNGVRTEQAVGLASRLIGEAGSLAGLISWTAADYRRMKGIGRIKGLQLGATAEIARRMMTAQRPTPPMLNRPELIPAHFATTVAGLQIREILGSLPQPEAAAIEASRGHLRHRHRGAGAPARSLSRRHPRNSPRAIKQRADSL